MSEFIHDEHGPAQPMSPSNWALPEPPAPEDEPLVPMPVPEEPLVPVPEKLPEGVMVDIETLSTHPTNAVVLSIGAVAFSLTKNGPRFNTPFLAVLELHAQLAAGREISAETLKFWSEQTPGARRHWAEGTPQKINDALHGFREYYNLSGNDLPIWANGICFDIGNLDSLYRKFFVPGVPWKYNSVRDARTMYRATTVFRERGAGTDTGHAHDPVTDCINQVWSLWEHWPTFDQ